MHGVLISPSRNQFLQKIKKGFFFWLLFVLKCIGFFFLPDMPHNNAVFNAGTHKNETEKRKKTRLNIGKSKTLHMFEVGIA